MRGGGGTRSGRGVGGAWRMPEVEAPATTAAAADVDGCAIVVIAVAIDRAALLTELGALIWR